MWLRINYFSVFESVNEDYGNGPVLIPYGVNRHFVRVNKKEFIDDIIGTVIEHMLLNNKVAYSLTQYSNALSCSLSDYCPSFINLNKKIDNACSLYNKYANHLCFSIKRVD